VLGHTEAIDEAVLLWTGVLERVGAADLGAPSGCADWSNRELVNHLVGGGDRYAILLRGGGEAEVAATRSTDYVGDGDPVAPFWLFQNAFRDAMATADLDVEVEHRAGWRPGRQLVAMRVMELALHAYDLAQGIGATWEPSDGLVEYLLVEAVPILDEFRGWGMVDAVGEAASQRPVDRLLALAGRH